MGVGGGSPQGAVPCQAGEAPVPWQLRLPHLGGPFHPPGMGLPGARTGHPLTTKEGSPEPGTLPSGAPSLQDVHRVIPGSKGQAPAWLGLVIPKGLQDGPAGEQVLASTAWQPDSKPGAHVKVEVANSLHRSCPVTVTCALWHTHVLA